MTESHPTTGIPLHTASAYLVNVAETIQNSLLPLLEGRAAARAAECVGTLARIAAHLAPPPTAADPAYDLAEEAQQLVTMEAAAAAVLRSIRCPPEPPALRRFDQSRLQDALRAQPLGGPGVQVMSAQQLQGGRSKQTILVQLQGAAALPADIIIRQDWSSAVTGTSVVSEFALLQHLFDAQLKVPQPLLLETSPRVLGAPFIIVTRLRGKAEGDPFTPPLTAQPVLTLAAQLGRLHALDVAPFTAMPGITERAYTAGQLSSDLKTYRGVVATLDEPSATLSTVLEWLEAYIAHAASQTRSLVHGDLGFHNFLCDQGDLTAILDWEVAHIGSPAFDLGYMRSMVERAVPWPEFMQHYHAAGGPQVDPLVLDFYTLFAGLWLYQLLLQARAGVTSGAVHDMEITYVCSQFLPALSARLSRELDAVLSRYPNPLSRSNNLGSDTLR